jgi:hypothetical protein
MITTDPASGAVGKICPLGSAEYRLTYAYEKS